MEWSKSVKTGIGWPMLTGLAALMIAFGGFGTWAAVAPLNSAVIAPGKVAVSGRNKSVQHLEGGIIREIMVREGERVSFGEPLLLLKSEASDADLERLKARSISLAAVEARALAEQQGAEVIAFDEALGGHEVTPELSEVLEDQRSEFRARGERYRAELAILGRQIAAYEEAILGYEAQRRETREQIGLVIEERQTFEELLERGLTRRSQVLALKRAESDLEGRLGELTARIAEARQAIAETGEKLQRTEADYRGEASALLNEVRLKRAELMQQIRAAEDVTARIVVRAPASGTVMNLKTHNPGAVIGPGEKIMEIVPEDAELVVEAFVRPEDIDQVRIGQEAHLQFMAFSPLETPPVPGEVVHVSADRLEEERTGDVYYLVRLAISRDPPPGFDPAKVGPGQPVEIFITTGERTLISYLVEPVTRTLSRSLRER